MKKTVLFLLLALSACFIQAQFIQKKSISAQVGIGLSAPNNSVDGLVDDGFFAQAELILTVKSWLELRPYTGFISTNAGGEDLDGNPSNEIATTKAFLMGGKARARAKLGWFAPYVEAGVGTSIGSYRTLTFFDDIDKSGITYHIPLSAGIEFGRKGNFDLGLMYLLQPSVKQYAGAFAIGVTFPLN